ncbi:GatB/YqeY domain-containing protein [candidate division KSB1 bacterium]|nr:GatB/YqeY domain-containing protein [candidate division KSB1 bacterium]NIR69926.1 GatB/YqeY domain-containing protein [candidate division KSB1 bacterium]NIS25835.1 GatB/YqeY domain-containing protein [candidate division KSB1 bacterium]NIT72710.1 GatB/YqeY domain-containing protein [candidate division KSB1 bacterium]NIU26524.1 GatB/YqeY domain-containing protein [candidate division KSB1 bacterium]
MSLQEQLLNELKAAMKAKDPIRINTIRMVRGQMKDLQIEKGEELSPDDELAVLTSAAKKRKEAIAAYEQSGRDDLLAKEKQELDILSEFLPKQLSEAEIEEVVRKIIADVGASSMKDLGKVMKEAMGQLKGKAEGKVVQEIVRKKLS